MDWNSIISASALIISVGVAIFTILNTRYLQKKEHTHQIKFDQRKRLEYANNLMEKKVRRMRKIMNTWLSIYIEDFSETNLPPKEYIEEQYEEIHNIFKETCILYNKISYCFDKQSKKSINNQINDIEKIFRKYIDSKSTDTGMVEIINFIEYFWNEIKRHLQRP